MNIYLFALKKRSAGCVIFELITLEKFNFIQNLKNVKNFSNELNELLEM